jgi:hypothetical protein
MDFLLILFGERPLVNCVQKLERLSAAGIGSWLDTIESWTLMLPHSMYRMWQQEGPIGILR